MRSATVPPQIQPLPEKDYFSKLSALGDPSRFKGEPLSCGAHVVSWCLCRQFLVTQNERRLIWIG